MVKWHSTAVTWPNHWLPAARKCFNKQLRLTISLLISKANFGLHDTSGGATNPTPHNYQPHQHHVLE